MTTITHRGTTYRGQTADSIARRVWHRTAYVRFSCDPNNAGTDYHLAMVCRRDSYGTHVLASVVVRSLERSEDKA